MSPNNIAPLPNTLLLDASMRVQQTVHAAVKGLSVEELTFRPTASANSIAWLVWHLTRIQDDHIADVAHTPQIWDSGWSAQFALPFDAFETGYGQTSGDVAAVRANADQLLGYYDDVHTATCRYIKTLKAEDYDRIVDTRWDPPVTLAVRLVSIITDDLEHAGQAAYIRGLQGL